ncbi:MAG: 4-hydroxybenzoate polyprenyltransferase [Abditibacteriota bacterium]|nr:4-hydroxybenzoate polyprenyltransferase [Abditibacteriota bacterium]
MATSQPLSTPQSPYAKLRNYLELVKFSHTIFALPFALAAMMVAANGWPQAGKVLWILVAMVSARTAAMGFNRIVDRDIDALNPRTQNREIPAGKVSTGQAGTLVVLSSALFICAAWKLNFLAFVLSFPTLALLFAYSLCKRFTHLSHFVLGLCLGIAPTGAWIAVRDISSLWQLDAAPITLTFAILFWVAGFDVIYATMDVEFDRKSGLHSLVQKLGVPQALNVAKASHALFIALLWSFGVLAGLKVLFPWGVALIAAFLIYEHAIVRADDLRRVNAAFFAVNGAISVFFLVLVAVEVWLVGP